MRTSWLARLGGAVAGALALGPGDAAWAAATIPLNPSHTNTTAQGFQSRDCTGGLLLGLGALALAGTAGLGLVVVRRRRDVA